MELITLEKELRNTQWAEGGNKYPETLNSRFTSETLRLPLCCFSNLLHKYRLFSFSPKIIYSLTTTFTFIPCSKPMVHSWHFHTWIRNTSEIFNFHHIISEHYLPTFSPAYSSAFTYFIEPPLTRVFQFLQSICSSESRAVVLVGDDFALQRTLAMSGNTFDCQNWRGQLLASSK